MRKRFRWTASEVAFLLVAACSNTAGARPRARASRRGTGRERTGLQASPLRASCGRLRPVGRPRDVGALEQRRHGRLPSSPHGTSVSGLQDQPPYIPHTEMVSKIARESPRAKCRTSWAGPDLRTTVRGRDQLVDVTDRDRLVPSRDRQPGPLTVATYGPPLWRAALRRRLRAVLQQDLSAAGLDPTARRPAWPRFASTRQDHGAGRRITAIPAGQLRRVQTSSPSAR